MRVTHENIRLFWKLFLSSFKESSHEESKTSPFLNLQIHPANPANPDILKFITKLS